jgi:zinc and cadmium transporter
MPDAALPALLSVLAVSVLSFSGASLLALGPARLQRVLPLLVALAAGALLGSAFLHLLPEAVEDAGGLGGRVAWTVLGGIVLFFLIESLLHWHHHGEDVDAHVEGSMRPLAWMNLLGDFIHNLIDGMLIAGAWLVGPDVGLATTVAVALHEIPQEFGDFGILLHAGLSPRRALSLNFVCALGALAGALAILLAHGSLELERHLVPLAAGGFLYVACADLVPELRRRARGWALVATVLALLGGLALMALLADGHGHTPSGGH